MNIIAILMVVLLLPGAAYSQPVNEFAIHTVKPGDNLWQIGQWYGVNYWAIMDSNGLSGTLIYPGQKLWILLKDNYSREEINLLARVVRAEAEGEPYAGKVAVAAVVLNRLDDDRFPDTLYRVIYQKNAFEPVTTGRIWAKYPSSIDFYAVQDALNGWDPSHGALFFWNPTIAASKWMWARPLTTVIGNHYFHA